MKRVNTAELVTYTIKVADFKYDADSGKMKFYLTVNSTDCPIFMCGNGIAPHIAGSEYSDYSAYDLAVSDEQGITTFGITDYYIDLEETYSMISGTFDGNGSINKRILFALTGTKELPTTETSLPLTKGIKVTCLKNNSLLPVVEH